MAFREFQNVVKHTKKLPRRKSGIQSDFSLEKIFESFTVTDEQLYRLSLNSLSDRVKRFSTICCRSIATVVLRLHFELAGFCEAPILDSNNLRKIDYS